MMSGKNATMSTASITANRTGLSQASAGSILAPGCKPSPVKGMPRAPGPAHQPRRKSIMRASRQLHAKRASVAKHFDEPFLHGLPMLVAGRLAELYRFFGNLQR